MTIKILLNKIAILIINPLILLGFIIATIYFFYGIADLIWNSDSKDMSKKFETVKYGILGFFIMFSVYGILRIALSTFGIPCTLYFC